MFLGWRMWKQVYIEDIGKTLIENEIYLCKSGNRTFRAMFQYGCGEYWWIDLKTNQTTAVREYKVKT